MAQATVATKVHQTLDAHRDFAAQITFDGELADLVARANTFSIRTRDKDGTVILVVKASVGSDTSANGVSRLEFEEVVPMTLDHLDQILVDAGFTYQAKWSREREEYVANGITVCLDKNAGYGYLAEFEKVVDSQEKADAARTEIDSFMAQVGALELPQDRLERMFAYYNTHWPEYYGTEKIFDIQ
jgi:predicted adenylyl cyclase CyaB